MPKCARPAHPGTCRQVPKMPKRCPPAHCRHMPKDAEYAEEVPTGTLSAHTEKMPKDAEYAEYAEEVPSGTLSAHTKKPMPKMPKRYPPAIDAEDPIPAHSFFVFSTIKHYLQ